MTDGMPNLIVSDFSGHFTKDGVTVDVFIVKLEGGAEWTLEVMNSEGTSTVWNDTFLDDHEAYAEFQRTVIEEGMSAFSDEDNVTPFHRR